MPLSWNEIKSRAIAVAAAPMNMATVAGRFAYLFVEMPTKAYASSSSPLTGAIQ
jgi:thiazole synthase ThiGH ThiG subunit